MDQRHCRLSVQQKKKTHNLHAIRQQTKYIDSNRKNYIKIIRIEFEKQSTNTIIFQRIGSYKHTNSIILQNTN